MVKILGFEQFRNREFRLDLYYEKMTGVKKITSRNFRISRDKYHRFNELSGVYDYFKIIQSEDKNSIITSRC